MPVTEQKLITDICNSAMSWLILTMSMYQGVQSSVQLQMSEFCKYCILNEPIGVYVAC